MPYPSCHHAGRGPARAVRLFHGQRGAGRAAQRGFDHPWPLNMRWPMARWQLMFAPSATSPRPPPPTKLTRGAYLVEGPGHCGACHTPRGLAYQEKALSMADGDAFLTGAVIDGWRARACAARRRVCNPGARRDRAVPEDRPHGQSGRFRRDGRRGRAQHPPLRGRRPGGHRGLPETAAARSGQAAAFAPKADSTTAALLDGRYGSRGAVIYVEQCVACHRADSQGHAAHLPGAGGQLGCVRAEPAVIIRSRWRAAGCRPTRRMRWPSPCRPSIT